MAVVKNLMVRTGADFSGLKNEMAKTQKQLGDFKSSVSGTMRALKVTLAGLGIGAAIKSAVGEAMQVEASIQQIDRILGNNAKEFTKWANTQALAFNLSKSEALKYGSVYGNLIAGFSKDTSKTLNLTESLLKASAVVASGTGRTMEDVMERIRSGLLGNTEAIEDLGIYAQVGMIKTTAAFKKFANGKSWDQLSYQTQQQIRLYSILEQVTTKFGGTLLDNANSDQQRFIAQMKNLQLSIGQAFLPIYQFVLPALTSLAAKLGEAANMASQFMQALFGSKAVTQQTKATTQQAGAVSDLGDAYEEAGKQAKGSTAGFDEVNTLSSASANGTDTSAAAAAVSSSNADSGTGEAVSPAVTGALDNFKKLLEPLKNIDLTPLTNSLANIKNAVAPLTDKLFAGLKWFWDNVLVPFSTWAIEDAIPAFLNVVANALNVVNPLLDAFRPLAEWLWVNFLQPIATWTGGAIVTILNDLGTALGKIGVWMAENKPIITGITIAVGSFIAVWETTKLLAFIELSGGLIAAVQNITTAIKAGTIAKLADKAETIALTALYAKDFVVSLAAGTAALVTQAAQWVATTAVQIGAKAAIVASTVATYAVTAAQWLWNAAMTANPIGLIIVGIGALIAIVVMLIENWDKVKAAAIAFWNSIMGWIQGAPDWLLTLINPLLLIVKHWDKIKAAAIACWNGIVTAFSVAGKWFGDVFNTVWTNIKAAFDGVGAFFTDVWNKIKTSFVSIGTKIGDAVGDAFKSVINGVLATIENTINGAFGFINAAIKTINKLPGVNIGTLSGVSLPRLATGGITNGPMTAVIGDNPGGEEVVSPLDDLKSMIAEVMTAVMSTQQNTGHGGDIVMQVDGTTIARVIKPYQDIERGRVGKVLIQGV